MNIDIGDLRNKLMNLEKDFTLKLNEVEIKEKKFKEMDLKVDEIISKNDSVITLNVGGKIFQTKLSTLLSVKDTIFYRLLGSFIESGSEISKELFFDRSYHYFPLILDFLRTKKYSINGYGKFYLDDILKETEYYGISEISNHILEMQKEIEFVNWEAAPRYSTAGTHNLQDLKDKSLMKGICVQAPYHIIIELNFEHEIDAMEVGGWNGNSGVWYPGNGANSRILTSVDKVDWVDVGNLPSNFTSTITTVQLRPTTAKYIKFQHTSYLGLGYLDLKKKK
jgi:hypothetical protein